MGISKISFNGETSLLNKMYNKASTSVQQQQEVQQTNKSNHAKRNWVIGLSSAATLISLGVLGRRGYLGERIQRITGGVKKHTSDIAEEAQTKLEDIIHEKAPEISIKVPKLTPEQIKINERLDRSIPEITQPLKLEEIPSLPEHYDEILKTAKEQFAAKQKKIVHITVDKQNYDVYFQNGKITAIKDPGNLIMYDDYGNLVYHEQISSKLGVFYNNGEVTHIRQETKNGIYNYNTTLRLNDITQQYGTDQKIDKLSIITSDGHVGMISHCDTNTKKELKRDWFNSKGEITREEFFSENGELTDIINY